MNLSKIPKFVVNLKRRPERLEHIKKEMEYIGWEFELFEAIDNNCHVGCTLSHLEIIKIAQQRNYDSVMVIEDDCSFMPYSKDLIEKLETETPEFDFAIFNLSPTFNRPVNVSSFNNLLIDITNLPPMQEHHRGIYATNMIIYNKSIYDELFEITGTTKLGIPYLIAIDEFIYKYIATEKQSYSPILPVAPQMSSWSDVSGGDYNNFLLQTYNWNLYSPTKIPGQYMDYSYNLKIKSENKHEKLNYDS